MNKPQPLVKKIFSATEIRDYIEFKFKKTSPKFWNWFFSECRWGETNLLDLLEPYEGHVKYIDLIKQEFESDANEEDGSIEIENDL